MKRRTIVWVNLKDATLPELGTTRPGILSSPTEQNHILQSVGIVPIYTRAPEIWPPLLRLEIPKKLKVSFVVRPDIRQVSRPRLVDVIGRTSPKFHDDLDEALAAYLDL